MSLITEKAMETITYHLVYFHDLRMYIRSLQTKEDVAGISYGTTIPVEHQSQVLKDLIGKRLSLLE